MSKNTLKRTLLQLNTEQIRELLLDLYEARKEAREYLDFYVAPDPQKKLDRTKTLIAKETSRMAKGYSRMRITRVKRLIKDLCSLNPGTETELEIMIFSVEKICEIDTKARIKDATQSASARLLKDTIVFADRHGYLATATDRLEKAVSSMASSFLRPNPFKRLMAESLKEALMDIS